VLIDLFRWDKEGDPGTLPMPSFADELTLMVSDKISTKYKATRSQKLKRIELLLPSGKARLKEHILSSKLWDLEVSHYDYFDLDFWLWTPPHGGKFGLARISNEAVEPVPGGIQAAWQKWTDVIS